MTFLELVVNMIKDSFGHIELRYSKELAHCLITLWEAKLSNLIVRCLGILYSQYETRRLQHDLPQPPPPGMVL